MPDKDPISNAAAVLTDAAEQVAMIRDTLVYLTYERTAWADITAASQVYHITQASTMLQSAADNLRYAAERIAALTCAPAPDSNSHRVDGLAGAVPPERAPRNEPMRVEFPDFDGGFS